MDFVEYNKTFDKEYANNKRNAYIKRHEKSENWNDPNTAGWWARYLLWEAPTLEEAYNKIKVKLKSKAYSYVKCSRRRIVTPINTKRY